MYSFGDDYATSERAIFVPCRAQADAYKSSLRSIFALHTVRGVIRKASSVHFAGRELAHVGRDRE